MNDQELIAFLWRSGNFWNSAYPDTLNVKESDLPKLTLADAAVQHAVQSFQTSDAKLDQLVRVMHGRALIADGGVGPATIALANAPRCPLPDRAPPPNATFWYPDPAVRRAVESMQERATGSGSFPAGCYGMQGVHEVKISYDLRSANSKQEEWWDTIKHRSHAAVAAVGVRLIEVPVGQGNIAVSFRSLGGSTIGLAEFNNGTCGSRVFCYLNPNYSPNIDQVLVLLLHENGHNWNLDHRSGNIMNPSILAVKPAWIERDASGRETYRDNSYPTLEKYFGGKNLDPPTPPGPPVGAGYLRLSKSVAAGTYGDFILGDAQDAGDYLLLPTSSEPRPIVPD